MLWDTRTFIKFSIPLFLIVGVLTWRLGPETEEKFPAYHTSKSDSKKDSKITKVTRSIKEKLAALDKWRTIKKTKPRTKPRIDITNPKEGYKTAKVNCRVYNVDSLSVLTPKNETSFSTGDTVLISWEESRLPACAYRRTYLHYKINEPGLGWYFIKDVPSFESINKYYWSIPEELRGQNILVSVGVSCHTGTWDVGPVCRSLFID